MTVYPARSKRILPTKDDLARIMKRLKELAVIIAILILLLIVSSDGEWFPWANFIALAVLAVMVHRNNRSHSAGPVVLPTFPQARTRQISYPPACSVLRRRAGGSQ